MPIQICIQLSQEYQSCLAFFTFLRWFFALFEVYGIASEFGRAEAGALGDEGVGGVFGVAEDHFRRVLLLLFGLYHILF